MCVLPSVRSRPGLIRPGWLSLAKVLFLIAACLCVLGAAVVVSTGDTRAGTYEDITVQPGDTVWAIAAQRYPDSDVRVRVDEIMRANALDQALIQPGQHLRVPAG